MAANTPQKLLYFVFVSLALPLVLNCKGKKSEAEMTGN